jgi:hypothetical protein
MATLTAAFKAEAPGDQTLFWQLLAEGHERAFFFSLLIIVSGTWDQCECSTEERVKSFVQR